MARQFHSYWVTASGLRGREGETTALFPYWSFTKTVIAILALKLAEEGKLDLDASIEDAPYTLRHLLAHTAGLPDYGHLDSYHQAVARQDPPWTRAEMLDTALAKGMLFTPGQGWSYSNIGYMFAVEILAKAAGKPFCELLADYISAPLGLSTVTVAETQADFAMIHWPAAAHYNPAWVYHGCLVGTPVDAAQILHGLMMGDLLTPGSMAQMLDRTDLGGAIAGRPWTNCGYALGLMSGTAHDAACIGHSGAGPFCVNAIYHFPDRSDPITVASFTNGALEGIAEYRAVELAF